MGITLREVVFDIGGGVPDGKKFKAVLVGGPSGGCLPDTLLESPIDYDSLTKVGAIMGSGGIVVLDEDSCMVDTARFFTDFCIDESCGKCTPCRAGLARVKEIYDQITSWQRRNGRHHYVGEIWRFHSGRQPLRSWANSAKPSYNYSCATSKTSTSSILWRRSVKQVNASRNDEEEEE